MDLDLGDRHLARFAPSRETGVALLTEAALVLCYLALDGSAYGSGSMMLMLGLVIPLVTIVVPLLWTTVIRDEPMANLGISGKRILPALLLAFVLVNIEVLPLTMQRPRMVPSLWVPQALAGALSLFEVLFVFGWLQSRFEHDYGVLPAILLTGACFALYHVGSGSSSLLMTRLMEGVLYATAYRMVTNLLVLWPVVWAASGIRLCVFDGYCRYDMGTVAFLALLLAIEVAFISVMGMRQRSLARARRVLGGADPDQEMY